MLLSSVCLFSFDFLEGLDPTKSRIQRSDYRQSNGQKQRHVNGKLLIVGKIQILQQRRIEKGLFRALERPSGSFVGVGQLVSTQILDGPLAGSESGFHFSTDVVVDHNVLDFIQKTGERLESGGGSGDVFQSATPQPSVKLPIVEGGVERIVDHEIRDDGSRIRRPRVEMEQRPDLREKHFHDRVRVQGHLGGGRRRRRFVSVGQPRRRLNGRRIDDHHAAPSGADEGVAFDGVSGLVDDEERRVFGRRNVDEEIHDGTGGSVRDELTLDGIDDMRQVGRRQEVSRIGGVEMRPHRQRHEVKHLGFDAKLGVGREAVDERPEVGFRGVGDVPSDSTVFFRLGDEQRESESVFDRRLERPHALFVGFQAHRAAGVVVGVENRFLVHEYRSGKRAKENEDERWQPRKIVFFSLRVGNNVNLLR